MDYFFIGEEELVTAFAFVGIKGISVNNPTDAKNAFYESTDGSPVHGLEKCRILILTEEVASWLGDILVNWQLSDRFPLIAEIPGLRGHLPDRRSLMDSIREAFGIHV